MGRFLRHQLIDGFPINRHVCHLYFLLKSLLILIKQEVKRKLQILNLIHERWSHNKKNLPLESFSTFEVKMTPLLNLTTSIHRNVIDVIAVLFQVIFTQCGIIRWQFSCYFRIGNWFTSIIFILLFQVCLYNR